MATYLLTWNPTKWKWQTLEKQIDEIKRTGYSNDSWSCGVSKRILPGDRVFLMKLGKESPKGIVASGWATSEFGYDKHWGQSNKTALYIDLRFDVLLNPNQHDIFARDWLNHGIYRKVKTWEPQASGMTIPDDVAAQLEEDWARFVNRPAPYLEGIFAEEELSTTMFTEGAVKTVTVNYYERSSRARMRCIQHHGLNCSVCSFNFKASYGEVGANFIHVHHLKPLHEIKKGYQLDPIRDLRPVCPNCHAMLHQGRPAYSIEKLRSLMKTAKSKRK
ncbi:MAG: HNH endonuclease [Anaerolineales bacterium]